jgi:hypothetical protein
MNPLPWTIEPDGHTFLIRDANRRIVAEVIHAQTAERIIAALELAEAVAEPLSA